MALVQNKDSPSLREVLSGLLSHPLLVVSQSVVFGPTASASFRAACPSGCPGPTLVLLIRNQELLSPQGLSLMLSATTSAHLEDPWQPASLPSTHPPSPGYPEWFVFSFQTSCFPPAFDSGLTPPPAAEHCYWAVASERRAAVPQPFDLQGGGENRRKGQPSLSLYSPALLPLGPEACGLAGRSWAILSQGVGAWQDLQALPQGSETGTGHPLWLLPLSPWAARHTRRRPHTPPIRQQLTAQTLAAHPAQSPWQQAWLSLPLRGKPVGGYGWSRSRLGNHLSEPYHMADARTGPHGGARIHSGPPECL